MIKGAVEVKWAQFGHNLQIFACHKKRKALCKLLVYKELKDVIPDGFEPSALGLKVRCSTAELRDRHFLFFGEHKNTGFFCFDKMKSSVEVISRPKNLENNPRDIPLGFVIL